MLSYEEMLGMSRPKSGHMHMDVRNRAKQFAPFDALRGFGESIREKNVVYSDRPVLCEDRKEELDRALRRLKNGDRIRLLIFREYPQVKPKGRFETVEGEVELPGEEKGKEGILQIEEREIPIKDIIKLDML